MTLAEGTQLGPYQIQSKRGEGGMGEVYLAIETKLGRKVALKIPPKELASNQDRMRRFTQEAKAAAGAESSEHGAHLLNWRTRDRGPLAT